jgi:5-methylcytosine-specific restriction protein A
MRVSFDRPRDWYYTYRWKHRSKQQLREHPLCKKCADRGVVSVAYIADHIRPHRGNWNEFWLGALQSLCRHCHESGKKFEELRGYQNDIGPDGWPLDPRHPTYRSTGKG